MKRWMTVALLLALTSWQMAYGQTKQQWIDSLSFYETNLTQAISLLKDSKLQTESLRMRLQQALNEAQSLRLSLEKAMSSQALLTEDLKKLRDSYNSLWTEYELIKRLLDEQASEQQAKIQEILQQHSVELAIAQRKKKLLQVSLIVVTAIAFGEAVVLIAR